MKYNLQEAIDILSRTPKVLNELLRDVPTEWGTSNEGDNTWSPFDVVGHLVHGEKTDWITRANIILGKTDQKTFTPFDRFAQEKDSIGKTLNTLLEEFETLRKQNVQNLINLNLQEGDYTKQGIHPELGVVTMEQLLSVWVAHDLGHIAQITRVMAKQYKENIGPWKAYLRIVND